ncbi:MmgE/PrpD family protein [Saccharopolyspora sp. 5N708]|uniref:MmgE/PrpD family protein n=1 Tax=Saccharopolyspora sp. 5N708 TaxID=3457424 RepID=UPI003FD3E184
MSLVAELADRAHAVAGEPIPEQVRQATQAHLADTVAAVIAGSTTLREHVERLADGVQLRPGSRRTAFVAGVYANGWEVAGIHRAAVLCPGCVVLPATLAALEMRPDVRWSDYLRAYLAGYEVALAAALAVGGDRLIQRGWWPTALLAPLGGAAAASILLGQSVAETASAIALAAQQAGGAIAGSTADADGRYLLSGLAAERAISAVLSVRAGWRGPLDILEDPRSPVLRQRTPPDGYLLPQTSMKAHAGAKHVQAAVDAVTTVDGADVLGIRCELPGPLVRAVDRPPPFGSSLNALASAQYMLAVAVRRGRCSPWEFQPELLRDERILDLADRVKVAAADDLSATYPTSWGARVEVRTTSGAVQFMRRDARGDPGHELTTAELVEKIVTLAGRSLGDETARDLAAALLGADPSPAVLTNQVLPLLRRPHAFQEA